MSSLSCQMAVGLLKHTLMPSRFPSLLNSKPVATKVSSETNWAWPKEVAAAMGMDDSNGWGAVASGERVVKGPGAGRPLGDEKHRSLFVTQRASSAGSLDDTLSGGNRAPTVRIIHTHRRCHLLWPSPVRLRGHFGRDRFRV